ncbi:MAG: S41 family peptidase [Bacteroidales bacterium]|nr:S41 family peptidase [Bacteroidales bacterium]MCI2121311.1 S41 family peptidase [Bacteroidales bacterium]MCI2145199.1 S41 family peptidase [Bacteroidales bacterium]
MKDRKDRIWDIVRLCAWVVVIIMLSVLIYKTDTRHKIRVDNTAANWNKMLLVLQNVDDNYVDDIDYKSVTEKTLSDILRSLDPHSVYLPPKDLKKADESLSGEFGGIGIEFNVPNDTAIVANVISKGPSQKAGICSGDRIIKVDGEVIAGVKMPQDSMVARMRGPKGSKVDIDVKRLGDTVLIPFKLTRATIPVKSIDVAYMINDTTGYIKLSKFQRTTYKEFMPAMDSLRRQGMRKLIFDLRENLGGYLDQAALLSNEFLETGDEIVYMEGKHRKREDLKADGKGLYKDMALDVLIDDESASSSEIFTGAMQDNDRATIYGRRSFGKGLVQEPVYFSDGSGIRLTVARYYTPSGRCIQKPYSDDYMMDVVKRYEHGEMTSADSIPVNDSLKFTTKGGRTVYGGGGIIPDVFVPIDTTAVSDFYIACNRKNLLFKYVMATADKYRARMASMGDLKTVENFVRGIGMSDGFLAYAKMNGLTPTSEEWEKSGPVMTVYLEAMLARYTPLDDDAFYPILLTEDNVVKAALKGK